MRTVIVADDSTDFNSKCRDFLAKDNTIKVIQTFNGKDTLEKYKELHPDAMILDYRLPKMNGKKVLDRIEEYEKEKNSVKRNVVFVTGSAIVDTKLFNNPKIFNFLPKPVDPSRISENLDDIFEWSDLEKIDYDAVISDYLAYLGIEDTKTNNFRALSYAIELVMKNPNLWRSLNVLYYLLGKHFDKTERQVESNLRYSISIIRKNMPKELQKSMFNIHSRFDKLTTRTFFDKTVVYFRKKKIIK